MVLHQKMKKTFEAVSAFSLNRKICRRTGSSVNTSQENSGSNLKIRSLFVGGNRIAMESLEIEVKFFLSDLKTTCEQIRALGAYSAGRSFETNIRFEDQTNSLIEKKSLLRLRQDTKTTLTYKCEPDVNDVNYKIFNELEVEVNDFTIMGQILESLGYHREQIYEKWRDSYTLNGAVCCIDEMPFGSFLEIEGNKQEIKEVAIKIGMQWEQRIVLNYFEVFEILRSKLNLPFTDITFNNFRDISFDLKTFIPLLESHNKKTN
jgi:adenylate cyclase class 2